MGSAAALSNFRRSVKPDHDSAKWACEQRLGTFIRQAWNVVEPATAFLHNWHLDLIAEYLEAVTAGQIKRLLMNVPPRYMKSKSVSVFWPTWCWARRPEQKLSPDDVLTGAASRWIFASYADELVIDHSMQRRRIMASPWYQQRWGDRVSFSKDQNRQRNYQNTKQGVMLATSISGSAGLGKGGNCLPGETIIETEEGKIAIGALVRMKRPPRVLSYNHESGECEYRAIIANRTTKTDELVEFRTRRGHSLHCTARHRIYSGGEYRGAGLLEAGDNIFALRALRGNVPASTLGYNQETTARWEAPLLRDGLCWSGVHDELRASVQEMRALGSEEGSQGLRREMVRGLPPDNDDRAIGGEQGGPQADLSEVRDAISTTIRDRAILFCDMRGPSSFRANGWSGELPLQGWRELREMVRFDAPAYFGARSESLRELFCAERRDDEVWFDHSSPRQEQAQQFAAEFGGSLPTLSCATPQADSIVMVGRLHTPNLEVYDLQVEGNSNFFADEILVHNSIVVDDPHNTREAESDADRTSAIETFRATLSTRHDDKRRGVIVVIMQRLNELDLSGYLLELGGWEHLLIQGEYEEKRTYIYPRSKNVIERFETHSEFKLASAPTEAPPKVIPDGGLLWPEREGPKEIEERKIGLGGMGFASQYQGRPAPKGGALFKHVWWRYWRTLPRLDRIIMVADTAYEEGDDNSYSNFDVWGYCELGFVLCDNWHRRVAFPELKRAAIWMAAKWKPEAILIEARASGRSLIQELKRPPAVGSNEPTLQGSIPVTPIEPELDKYTRAVAVTPIPEAGLVWFPDKSMPADPMMAPEGYAWVDGYEHELELFPAGKLNDRVDTFVHAITYLRGQGSVLDFYRRLQQHQDAVEAAQEAVAHGRKPKEEPNSAMEAYKRGQKMWEELAQKQR